MPKTKALAVFPVQMANGKWAAADLLPEGGYINPEHNALRRQFKTHAECQSQCNFHNNFHGYTEQHIKQLILKTLALAVA